MTASQALLLHRRCFRCGAEAADEWFDGPGTEPERANRRAICAPCEAADWKAIARALGTCPIG